MNIGAVRSSAALVNVDTKQQDTAVKAPVLREHTGADANEREELENAVLKLNKTAEIFNHDVKFVIHDKTHRIMVQVLNKNTDEVVSEAPPRKILDMVAQFQEMVGLLVDKKV